MPESSERGALTEAVFYILLSLYKPMHGYTIVQNIDVLSAGRVVLGAGTLYGALGTLVAKGWIAAAGTSGPSRKKEYLITDEGKTMVVQEIVRLKELIAQGEAVTKGGHDA